MEFLYGAVALIVIILMINITILPNVRLKKIYTLLQTCEDKGFFVKAVKNKNYDFLIENENMLLLIKTIFIPRNSSVTINSKDTWKLQWGGSSHNKGRVYPNDRYLNELTPFLKEVIKKDKKVLKVIMLYPSTEKVLMYLNESELDLIDIDKTPYGYKVTTFATFAGDFDKIINIK